MHSYTAPDGVRIAYSVWNGEGPGPAIVLQHGLAGSTRANWIGLGVVDALAGTGRRIISVDARGHGESDKPHDPASYGEATLARDLIGVLDELRVESFDMVGYSMGGVIAAAVAAQDPRVRRLVIGGVGASFAERASSGGDVPFNAALALALEADDVGTIADPITAGIRRVVDAMGADRRALAALARSRRAKVALDRIHAPTLVVAGDADPIAARPELLVRAIPGARLERLSGDHLSVLLGPRFAETLLAFLT